MPLPTVVSCLCDPAAAPVIPELVLTPRSRMRVPGFVDPGMRGYYPLGPFGGTDLSELGNDAEQATEPLGYVDGILCERAELMDGRQYYTLPFELSDTVTVSAWIRPARPRLETTLLSIGEDCRFGLSWRLEPIAWFAQDKPEEAVVSADPLIEDRWYHIAFVRDSAEVRIYVDGLPIAMRYEGVDSSPVFVSVETPSATAAISRYREGSGLHGAYQDVVVRASALEASEIAAEYESYCTTFFDALEV